MLQNMTLLHWVGVAIVAIIALHGAGIFDATKIPLVGGLFAKFLQPFVPKQNEAAAQVARFQYIEPASIKPIANVPVVVDQLDPHKRCEALLASLIDVRHFISERPTDKAAELLGACDTLEKEIQLYHSQHNGQLAHETA